MKNRLRWLYGTTVLIALAPIWSVRYLPTQDGPSHLYNSWLLRELLRGSSAAIEHAYRIDWRPHPNWLTSAVLALLMTVVPPLLAEKLFVSGIVLLFAAGIWMYAGDEGRPYAFLALPFAYSLLLQSGFYNFCAGLGLYFVTVAVWWRHRTHAGPRTIALVAALLLAGYFTHPLPTLLAMGSMTLLGIATRASWWHLTALVPVLPLFAWFARVRGGGAAPAHEPLSQILRYLVRNEVLFTFDSYQTWLGVVLAVLLGLLIVATIAGRPRGPRNAFLLPMLAMFAIYVFAPAGIVGGQMVRERMALFVVLAPLAWIAPRWPQKVTSAIAVGLALISIAYSGYLVRRYRAMDRRISELVDAARPIGSNTKFLPLLLGRAPRGTFVSVLSHAVDYVAIERRDVDLGNYEPGTGYFPIAYNQDFGVPNVFAIEADPASLDLEAFTPRAEYVFTFGVGAEAPVWTQLLRRYRRVSAGEHGDVWRIAHDRSSQEETILLPVAGSTGPRGAPDGVWWNVAQTVRNDGDMPVHLHARGCSSPPCEFDLAAHQSLPLAANGAFLLITAEAEDASHLIFSTVAERTGPDGRKDSMAFPAIRQAEFRRGTATIAEVPFRQGTRLYLRAWTFGVTVPALLVRVVGPDGRTLAEKEYGISDDAFSVSSDLRADFPNVHGKATVILIAGSRRVWGLISVTDPKTAFPAQLYPR